MTLEKEELLLKVVRKSLESREEYELEEVSDWFEEERGVFVTLTKEGSLRGCVGRITSDKPLHEILPKMALAAAYEDSRFPPVSEEELDSIEISVSILSEPEELEYESPEELKKELSSEDGVILKKGMRSATYLPQVWEQISDKERFLQRLSRKAGLGKDGWKDEDVTVSTYQVEKYEE